MSTRRMLLSCACVLLLASAGCMWSKQEYFINPDGSGKVRVESRFPILQKGREPESVVAATVRRVMMESRGIVAWSGVSCKVENDKVIFRGVAYFPDITKVRMGRGARWQVDWTKKNAHMILRLVPGGNGPPVCVLPDAITEETVKKKREELLRKRGLFSGAYSTLDVNVTLHLPGEVVSLSNFEKVAADTVRLHVDGKRLLEAWDRLIKDDGWLKRYLTCHRLGEVWIPLDDGALRKAVFGSEGPFEVVVGGVGKPLFNYGGEVKKAESEFRKFLAGYGMVPEVLSPPETEGRVVSATLLTMEVSWADESRVKEFRGDVPPRGISLNVLFVLDGKIVSVKKLEILDVVDGEGRSLLPVDGWKREVHVFDIGRDGRSVLAKISVPLPSTMPRRIGRIEGNIVYLVAKGRKIEDVGVMKMEAGEKAKKLCIQIKEIEAVKTWKGKPAEELSIVVGCDPAFVEDVLLFDEEGRPLKIERSDRLSVGGRSLFRFRKEGRFPPRARVKVVVRSGMEQRTARFTLRNVDIPRLGR